MVVFHPYAPNCCGLLQPGVGESYLEYPYDTGRTFLSLLFSGTLAKYRDVKWTFCHGGGTLPFLLGRILNLAENSREKLDVVAPEGIEGMLQSMYFDTGERDIRADVRCARGRDSDLANHVRYRLSVRDGQTKSRPAPHRRPLTPPTSSPSNAATPCASSRA